MSKAGASVLKRYRIAFTYETLSGCIINRAGSGICPMEEAVAKIDDPLEAFLALKKRAAELNGGKNAL